MDIPDLPPTRLERRKAQRRQQLVEAALQLLQTTTIRALNMKEVAELANFSKGTLYKYFGSRQAFVDAVIANQLLSARARVQCRLEKSQSCDEAVVETMQALLLGFLFVVDSCGSECLMEAPVRQSLLDAVDHLETRLSEFKVSEPQRLAAMACAWAHGLAVMLTHVGGPVEGTTIDAHASSAASLLLAGHYNIHGRTAKWLE